MLCQTLEVATRQDPPEVLYCWRQCLYTLTNQMLIPFSGTAKYITYNTSQDTPLSVFTTLNPNKNGFWQVDYKVVVIFLSRELRLFGREKQFEIYYVVAAKLCIMHNDTVHFKAINDAQELGIEVINKGPCGTKEVILPNYLQDQKMETLMMAIGRWNYLVNKK